MLRGIQNIEAKNLVRGQFRGYRSEPGVAPDSYMATYAARMIRKGVRFVTTQTDIGNKQAIGGLSREFYRRVGKAYGQEEAWKFEPHGAETVLLVEDDEQVLQMAIESLQELRYTVLVSRNAHEAMERLGFATTLGARP